MIAASKEAGREKKYTTINDAVKLGFLKRKKTPPPRYRQQENERKQNKYNVGRYDGGKEVYPKTETDNGGGERRTNIEESVDTNYADMVPSAWLPHPRRWGVRFFALCGVTIVLVMKSGFEPGSNAPPPTPVTRGFHHLRWLLQLTSHLACHYY